MITNGFDVAVMEHHVSSSAGGFTNQYSQARVSFYNIGGIPDSYFDGTLHEVGGYSGTYNAFVNLYNQRMAVQSDFTVDINGFNDGLDYTVLLSFENVATYTGTNIVAQLAITESDLPYGSSVFDYVTRYFVPNTSGTPLDFSSGSSQQVMLEFSMDPSWVIENCEFIGFIQDMSSKQILQATKVMVPDLAPMFYNNASSLAINMVPVLNCTGEVAPQVTIANEGADALTTLDINYNVNDGSVSTYGWTGSLGYGETAQVDLPAIAFDVMEDNDLMIYTTNPNGSMDEDPYNDTLSTMFNAAQEVIPAIHLYLKLDNNPAETTWEVLNSSGDVLYSGGPYSDPLLFIQETFPITDDDCYTFAIYDSEGDGLADPGFFELRQNNYNLFYENQDFDNTEELVQFSVNQVSVPETAETAGLNIYPNPFEDYTSVSFTLNESVNVELSVYNIIGEVVYTVSQQNMALGNQKIIINTQDFTPGVYFVNLIAGDKVYTKKISSK